MSLQKANHSSEIPKCIFYSLFPGDELSDQRSLSKSLWAAVRSSVGLGLGIIMASEEQGRMVTDCQRLIKTAEKDILESDLGVQDLSLTRPYALTFVILFCEMGILLISQDYYEVLMKYVKAGCKWFRTIKSKVLLP